MGPRGSGKTIFALGLSQLLLEEGQQVGYFKPVADQIHGLEDHDVVLMHSVLEMNEPTDKMSVYKISSHYLSRYHPSNENLSEVHNSYRRLAEGQNMMLIEGAPLPFAMAGVGLDSLSLANHLRAPAVIIIKADHDFSLDRALLYCQYADYHGVKVLGVIMNHVPRTLLDKAAGVYKPLLEDKGFPVCGIIPHRPEMSSPTVREYAEVLNAEVLSAEDRLERQVEDILIGAMTLESAWSYLRRSSGKAFVTGGDRADLALAALETDTAALILTGGYFPDVKVVARAEEKGIPILLVPSDTYTTVEALHGLARKIKPRDREAIRGARDIILTFCDWPGLKKRLQETSATP